jgi:2-polyprenyl-3-methyl-5-hydroxy-6-metoxy-1,4-benzoquinol methylase
MSMKAARLMWLRPVVVVNMRHVYYSAVVIDVPGGVQILSDANSSSDADGLRAVRGVFEDLGREDPMYAALSRNAYRGNRWDPAEFFETGRTEIADAMSYVGSAGLQPNRHRALDFGCALGRLTQALADHFAEVVGVDIASSMIDRAREHNTHGSRVAYLVNTAPDLSLFESGTFDFIYTNKVLQHIPPEHQLGYIREFVRLLRPGGVALFQTRNGPDIRPGTVRALLYTLNRTYFRRLAQRVRGRPAYEMHFVARSRVESTVTDAGGRVADVVDLSRGKPARSLRYCVTK